MNQWFQVLQIGKGPDWPVVPKTPTFVWLNTAYYARQRAEVHFGVNCMNIIVALVKPDYVFPEDAVELVDDTDGDGGVHTVPLLQNARERVDETLKQRELKRTR
jgi:hypothetical protein